MKIAQTPIRGKIVTRMDPLKNRETKTLPPEFRPSAKSPKLSIQDIIRMRERLAEMAKGGKTFSVRDILTIRNEMTKLSGQQRPSSQNMRPVQGVQDSRSILMEKMKANRAKSTNFLKNTEEKQKPSGLIDGRTLLMQRMRGKNTGQINEQNTGQKTQESSATAGGVSDGRSLLMQRMQGKHTGQNAEKITDESSGGVSDGRSLLMKQMQGKYTRQNTGETNEESSTSMGGLSDGRKLLMQRMRGIPNFPNNEQNVGQAFEQIYRQNSDQNNGQNSGQNYGQYTELTTEESSSTTTPGGIYDARAILMQRMNGKSDKPENSPVSPTVRGVMDARAVLMSRMRSQSGQKPATTVQPTRSTHDYSYVLRFDENRVRNPEPEPTTTDLTTMTTAKSAHEIFMAKVKERYFTRTPTTNRPYVHTLEETSTFSGSIHF